MNSTHQPPRLSIVVATYQRAGLLTRFLESLALQQADRSIFEVLVVDNAASPLDQVQLACRRFAEAGLNVRYLHQPALGLSKARNYGIEHARAELVGFLDDDVLAPSTWVQQALASWEESGAKILGGPFFPIYTSTPPAWFRDDYASLDYGSEAGWLPKGKYLAGANLLISRDLFQRLGTFSESLGYVGTRILYGEDTEFQFRAIQSGYSIWYEPALAVRHQHAADRMSVHWILSKTASRSRVKMLFLPETPEEAEVPFHRRLRSLVRETVTAFGGLCLALLMLPWRDREKYPDLRNYLVEYYGKHLFKFTLRLARLERMIKTIPGAHGAE